MMTPDTSIYNDLSGFTSLRAQAQSNPDAALNEVAKQFESIFMQMMMKSMRDASEPLESEFGSSSQMKSYQQMFDQQLSLDLSGGGGLGLAEIIAEQLGGSSPTDRVNEPPKGAAIFTEGDLSKYRLLENVVSTVKPLIPMQPSIQPKDEGTIQPLIDMAKSSAPLTSELSGVPAESSGEDESWLPQSPQEFVDALWGLAKQAGEVLKQNPKVILAQAALETGWGKFMIPNADGSNSFNLFGIKAGDSWEGSEANVSTLEYENGIAQRQMDSFRSYESLAESFNDYVDFLTQSPRYEQALASTNEHGFAKGLQDSGYATDPKYAEKILGILSRPEFQSLEVSAGLVPEENI